MPRPMFLIKEPLLKQLSEEATIGVPVATLVSKYKLEVTPPTLSKMISHYKAMITAPDDKSKKIIELSLFPNWLDYKDQPIIKQPSQYRYSGSFPLGKWIKR